MKPREGDLEVVTYTPRVLGMVEEEDRKHFRDNVLYIINRAMHNHRKEDVSVAVDRIVYMLKAKHENVGIEFIILNKDTAVGKVSFLNEEGETMVMDSIVDRVGT